MNLSSGTRRRNVKKSVSSKKTRKNVTKESKKSKHVSGKTHISRSCKSEKTSHTRRKLPKTAKFLSKKSRRVKEFSRAMSGMTLTELQFLAKSRGIPFGELTKSKLIRKINNYY